MNETIKKAMEIIESNKENKRGAWNRGVNVYAFELLEELNEAMEGGYFEAEDLQSCYLIEKAFLNGADDFKQYSWGGCSLIYDYDIAERLCNPTELKRTRNGERRPNANEEWLDTQARALFQASNRAKRAIKKALEA